MDTVRSNTDSFGFVFLLCYDLQISLTKYGVSSCWVFIGVLCEARKDSLHLVYDLRNDAQHNLSLSAVLSR